MLLDFVRRYLFTINSNYFIATSLILFLGEFVLCHLIIANVKSKLVCFNLSIEDTEIDWSTYMQQVECFMNGTRNYSQIEGDTGPVVYPAGHIYVYGILYQLTDKGLNIRRAQYIFAGFYLLTLALVFRIYYKSKKVPPFALFFLCCISYRIHSIFILRLFNDPIAMLFFWIALNFWISHKWLPGCIFYSVAVSIKMNVLLFAPAVFFVLLLNNGTTKTVVLLFVCFIIQVLMALPFLFTDPVSYLRRSFDLGRVFLFKWTVNWRFLPPELFVSKNFHLSLLAVHFLLLMIFAVACWFRSQGGLISLLRLQSRRMRTRLGTHDILFALFTANLLGIAVARSLHYQFYSWYFFTLPYLVFSTLSFDTSKPVKESFKERSKFRMEMPYFAILLRSAILIGIEMCWNTYPSTILSCTALHALHISLICIAFVHGVSESSQKYKGT